MKNLNTITVTLALLFSSNSYAAFNSFKGNLLQAASDVMGSTLSKGSQTQSNSNGFKRPPQDFDEAKDWLKVITREHHPYGFYSGCKFNFSGRNLMTLTPNHSSCGYQIRDNRKWAFESHAEHILPISWVGNNYPCWKSGGRNNCRKTSKEFNVAEADLVNLQYIIGEINMDRSHYRFAPLTDGHDYNLNGKIYFDETGRRFMPPKENWGWIGRIHLYMDDNYPVRYSNSYKKLMQSWAKLPTTEWECKYNDLLIRDFGQGNPHTTKACTK